MKRILAVLIVILFSAGLSRSQMFERYSSNPLPKLNVVTLAIAEDLPTVKKNISENYRGNMQMEMAYPILVDASFKKLKEQGSVDISFFGKSATGKKFFSVADSVLKLNANLFSTLVIDRQKRVRAFSQALMVSPEQFARVVEELLLNIDGKESIDVSVEEGWSTDLAKQRHDAEPKPLINLGPSDEDRWYGFLGKPLPDLNLKTLAGSDTTLYRALDGKVTVLFVFVGSMESDFQMNIGGTAMMTKFMDNLYHAFTLGEIKPGGELVKNATPEGGQSPAK